MADDALIEGYAQALFAVAVDHHVADLFLHERFEPVAQSAIVW